MGIIYNENVQESKIYQAYGLTVYGKINRYVWATRENQEENALTAIRIVDASGNDILFMHLGNNVILQSIIDSTIDNFLYWILEDKPDAYTIKKQVLFILLCPHSKYWDVHPNTPQEYIPTYGYYSSQQYAFRN